MKAFELQSALLILGAEEKPEPPQGLDALDILSTAFFVIVGLIAFGYIFYKLKEGTASLQESMSGEEMQFEEELLKEVAVAPPAVNAPPEPARPTEKKATVWSPTQPIDSPPPPPPPAPVAAAPVPAASPPVAAPASPMASNTPRDLDDLVNRLKQLRIITDMEGRVALQPPPDGVIYRLRAGGSVLLLPRLESEAFLEFQTRRFEMIIALTHSGEPLIISRYQSRLKDFMDSPGEKR